MAVGTAGISVVPSVTGAAVTRSVDITIWDHSCRTVCFGSGAVFADMTRLAAFVTGLASCV